MHFGAYARPVRRMTVASDDDLVGLKGQFCFRCKFVSGKFTPYSGDFDMTIQKLAAMKSRHPDLRFTECHFTYQGIERVPRCQIKPVFCVWRLFDFKDGAGVWRRRVSKANWLSSFVHRLHWVDDSEHGEW